VRHLHSVGTVSDAKGELLIDEPEEVDAVWLGVFVVKVSSVDGSSDQVVEVHCSMLHVELKLAGVGIVTG
jgi:hypothetical protein